MLTRHRGRLDFAAGSGDGDRRIVHVNAHGSLSRKNERAPPWGEGKFCGGVSDVGHGRKETRFYSVGEGFFSMQQHLFSEDDGEPAPKRVILDVVVESLDEAASAALAAFRTFPGCGEVFFEWTGFL